MIGLKTLAPVYQPVKRKAKTNRHLHVGFSHALSKLYGIAINLDCFIALCAPAVIGQSSYFGIIFSSIENGSICWIVIYPVDSIIHLLRPDVHVHVCVSQSSY